DQGVLRVQHLERVQAAGAVGDVLFEPGVFPARQPAQEEALELGAGGAVLEVWHGASPENRGAVDGSGGTPCSEAKGVAKRHRPTTPFAALRGVPPDQSTAPDDYPGNVRARTGAGTRTSGYRPTSYRRPPSGATSLASCQPASPGRAPGRTWCPSWRFAASRR